MKKYVNGQYIEMTEEEIAEIKTHKPDPQYRIQELMQNLQNTDYVACKIAEGAATREEYVEVLIQREEWRKEINEMMKEA